MPPAARILSLFLSCGMPDAPAAPGTLCRAAAFAIGGAWRASEGRARAEHRQREAAMRVLFVHPGPLMYSEIYLRLEPLGMERVAQAVRQAGHEVRLIDLQTFTHRDFAREVAEFQPRAIGFSLNYLANVPEVVDLAKRAKRL